MIILNLDTYGQNRKSAVVKDVDTQLPIENVIVSSGDSVEITDINGKFNIFQSDSILIQHINYGPLKCSNDLDEYWLKPKSVGIEEIIIQSKSDIELLNDALSYFENNFEITQQQFLLNSITNDYTLKCFISFNSLKKGDFFLDKLELQSNSTVSEKENIYPLISFYHHFYWSELTDFNGKLYRKKTVKKFVIIEIIQEGNDIIFNLDYKGNKNIRMKVNHNGYLTQIEDKYNSIQFEVLENGKQTIKNGAGFTSKENQNYNISLVEKELKLKPIKYRGTITLKELEANQEVKTLANKK